MKLLLLLAASTLVAQTPVSIRVHSATIHGDLPLIWNFFGYDEPNYTYAPNGRKLIQEFAQLAPNPPRIRTHFLLATNNGQPGLKWGSTNAYTEDSSGHPIYDWSTVDRILSTYLDAGAKPFVEIGFTPEALSSKPQPYSVPWIPGDKNPGYSAGWSYPPADYVKWSELIYQWVKHSVDKYGKSEVQSWQWEVWNEPNISYWHGTADEYDKLYDYTAAAVKRALPTAHIGGPATTSPRDPKAAAFLRHFLQHCTDGQNFATGKTGSPLDFITFHAKGQPAVLDGHVRMGISQELRDVSEGFAVVRSFPRFRDLPIVLTEADPEGCAACSAQVYPQNAYRNGPLYATYTAAAMKAMLQIAARDHANLAGMLTWAFEFEDQPAFAGFRSLATHGIDKPVLNFFRMAGLMPGHLVDADSSAALPLETLIQSGAREQDRSDIDVLATRSADTLNLLVWNYHDDDVAKSAAPLQIAIVGLPRDAARVQVRHFRIDADHSNAYTVWKQLGSPQHPSPEQQSKLEAAGQLQLLTSPAWLPIANGTLHLDFPLPAQALSLLQISWPAPIRRQ